MFRIIIIAILVLTGLRMLGRLFAGPNMNGSDNRSSRGNQPPKRKRGNINIDYHPNKDGKKDVGDYKGGEYVDYEEVD